LTEWIDFRFEWMYFGDS